ncbi:MAG TPA: hypothetical protein VGI03_12115 [Verrucomicrobiae bacterium]|jgi:hypothetical protein
MTNAESIQKRSTAIILFGLAVITLLVYLPLLRHDFINYDDPDYILGNPHVNHGLTWSGITWAFQSAENANWHPLTWISHMIDCQLFGLNPAGHHLVNLLFHIANTLLLFLLLKNLTGARWRSAFVAAAFAWHPLHVESVAWASERKDVLSAFFWMLTLLAYAKYAAGKKSQQPSLHPDPLPSRQMGAEREQQKERLAPTNFVEPAPGTRIQNPNPKLFYFFALLMFACGLMSKPMVVTLPCVLFLLDFWPLGRFNHSGSQHEPHERGSPPHPNPLPRWGRGNLQLQNAGGLILEKIPFFALTFASCLVTMHVQSEARWSSESLPLSFRLENAAMSYVRYISKIFWPADLALIYPYPHSWPSGAVLGVIIVLAMLTVIFLLQCKKFPYLAMGWFWFLGTLVPTIGVVQVGVQSMADRYSYLPSIGIFILVAWGANDLLARWPERKKFLPIAAGLALAGCLAVTSMQLGHWRNSLTIFLHTTEVTTDNYAADDCLGKSLENIGATNAAAMNAAAVYYTEAVRLEPDYPMGQFDLGMLDVEQGNSADASNHLASAVRLDPRNSVMQFDYGVFLAQHGTPDAAADHFKTALADRPDFPEAQAQLDKLAHKADSPANGSTR